MKLELSETSKLSTIPVSPIMSLFNQFSTRSVNSLLTSRDLKRKGRKLDVKPDEMELTQLDRLLVTNDELTQDKFGLKSLS